MPFHPIALHFHLAAFMVNIAVIVILAFMRLGTSPNLIAGEKGTKGQNLFSTLDWVCVITIIMGLITTAIGIGTGFYELDHSPGVVDFGVDMFMQLKIYLSFVFLALYVIPLVARLKIGQKMWKSKGMAATYMVLIAGGFFFMWVTTFLGSYDTSYLISAAGGSASPVQLSTDVLQFLSESPFFSWMFIMFGAIPGNLITNYTPGVEVPFSWFPVIVAAIIVAALTFIAFDIFYGLRSRQINKYQEKYNYYKSLMLKEKISRGSPEYQQVLKEMIALEITPPNL